MPTENSTVIESSTPAPQEDSQKDLISPQKRVIATTIDFLRAMRTAPVSSAEAIEWATLEEEFTQRLQAS